MVVWSTSTCPVRGPHGASKTHKFRAPASPSHQTGALPRESMGSSKVSDERICSPTERFQRLRPSGHGVWNCWDQRRLVLRDPAGSQCHGRPGAKACSGPGPEGRNSLLNAQKPNIISTCDKLSAGNNSFFITTEGNRSVDVLFYARSSGAGICQPEPKFYCPRPACSQGQLEQWL